KVFHVRVRSLVQMKPQHFNLCRYCEIPLQCRGAKTQKRHRLRQSPFQLQDSGAIQHQMTQARKAEENAAERATKRLRVVNIQAGERAKPGKLCEIERRGGRRKEVEHAKAGIAIQGT